jgi:hypothetical protein
MPWGISTYPVCPTHRPYPTCSPWTALHSAARLQHPRLASSASPCGPRRESSSAPRSWPSSDGWAQPWGVLACSCPARSPRPARATVHSALVSMGWAAGLSGSGRLTTASVVYQYWPVSVPPAGGAVDTTWACWALSCSLLFWLRKARSCPCQQAHIPRDTVRDSPWSDGRRRDILGRLWYGQASID